MPVSYPYTQYSGTWNLTSQGKAIAAGTWPSQPNLYGWGLYDEGENGVYVDTSSPIQVGTTGNWSYITTGNRLSAALKKDGTLWVWGLGSQGQMGNNTTTRANGSPIQVGSAEWAAVAVGFRQVLAVKTNGTLWSWGGNAYGQLGLGNTTGYSSPKQVGALTNWLTVAAGTYASAGIKTDGTLWTWGRNTSGILGLGNTTNYSSPKQVGSLTNWLNIIVNYSFCLATKTDGTLWSWGRNDKGCLGLGNINYYSSPKQVGLLTNWLTLSSGYLGGNVSAVIKTDGTLWAWGSNYYGAMGINSVATYYFSSPVQVGALTNWSKIGVAEAVVAVKTNGTLWGWGRNTYGQIGDGTTINRSSPIQIGSNTNWTSASVGFRQTIGLTN